MPPPLISPRLEYNPTLLGFEIYLDLPNGPETMQSNIIHQTKADHGTSYGKVDGAMKPVSRKVLGSTVVDVNLYHFLLPCLAGLHLALSSSERRWLNLVSNSL
jgi:hypothetical protein